MKKILLALLALLMLAGCGGNTPKGYKVTYTIKEGSSGTISESSFTIEQGTAIGENIPEVTLSKEEIDSGWSFEGFYLNGSLVSGLDLANYVPKGDITIEISTIQKLNAESFIGILFQESPELRLRDYIFVEQNEITTVTALNDYGQYDGFHDVVDAISLLSILYDESVKSKLKIDHNSIQNNGHHLIEHFEVAINYPPEYASGYPRRLSISGYVIGTNDNSGIFYGLVPSGFDGDSYNYFFEISESQFLEIKEVVENLLFSVVGEY